ncbi:MAG: YfhO family protein, partial [Lachnospiraceae bacterium]|nr:YfhO family protein [Lachnospiraceae bacterium]
MRFKHKKLYLAYTLEFTVIILTLLSILKQFSFINTGDGFNQNYLFVVYIGKYLRNIAINFLHGKFFVPQFDFAIGLGEGIIPALNCYGFGDPFMLISAAFPAKYSTYAYTMIILSKMYVSGIGFIYYCRKRECKEKNILLGVPLYIAGQYVIYHGIMHSPTFLSIMISLPFICAGIDEVIISDGDKKVKISKCLVLAVAFQALNGFFTLYMELLFAALYALINLLCRVKGVLSLLKKGCSLFLQVILGMLISGVIFIPSIYGYVSSARSGDFKWIGWKALFQLSANTIWETFSSIIIPAGHQEIGLMLSVVSVFLICLAIKRNKT